MARGRILALFSVVGLLTMACGSGGAPVGAATSPAATAAVTPSPAPKHIKVAIAGGLKAGSLYWDVMVAAAAGFFEKNHLVPEFIDAPGGPDTVQAVVGGSADFGVGATDAIIRGINKNAPITMIAGGAYPPHALVTSANITSYEQLKGKRIAVTSVTAGSSLLLLELLKSKGLGEKDFEFVLSGATPQRLAAITSGAVQGTLLSPPEDLTAAKQGFRILGYVNEAAHFLFIGHMASKTLVQSDRASAVNYARAIRDANRFMLDPANKAASIAALQKYTSASQENAEATYETVIAKLHAFVKDAAITPQDLDGMLRIIEKADKISGLKTETYFDDSFLKEAGK